jgi:hypothetical protein
MATTVATSCFSLIASRSGVPRAFRHVVMAIAWGALLLLSLVPAVAQAASGRAAKQKPSLGAFLRRLHGGGPHSAAEAEWPTRYSAASVRLGSGRKNALIVYLTGAAWCGSGGCTTLVLLPSGSSFTVLGKFTITFPPIKVLSSKSRGLHDIGAEMRGGSQPFEAAFSFDGRRYPNEPRRAVQKTPGKTIISSVAVKRGEPLFPSVETDP